MSPWRSVYEAYSSLKLNIGVPKRDMMVSRVPFCLGFFSSFWCRYVVRVIVINQGEGLPPRANICVLINIVMWYPLPNAILFVIYFFHLINLIKSKQCKIVGVQGSSLMRICVNVKQVVTEKEQICSVNLFHINKCLKLFSQRGWHLQQEAMNQLKPTS